MCNLCFCLKPETLAGSPIPFSWPCVWFHQACPDGDFPSDFVDSHLGEGHCWRAVLCPGAVRAYATPSLLPNSWTYSLQKLRKLGPALLENLPSALEMRNLSAVVTGSVHTRRNAASTLVEPNVWTLSMSHTQVRRWKSWWEGVERRTQPWEMGGGSCQASSLPRIVEPSLSGSHPAPDRKLPTWLVKQPVCQEVSFAGKSHLVIQITRQWAATQPLSTGQLATCIDWGFNVRGEPDPMFRRYFLASERTWRSWRGGDSLCLG